VRPARGRRRAGDANPDLKFLTLEEFEAVIRAIPDEIVVREPKPFRAGRAGPCVTHGDRGVDKSGFTRSG